MATIFISYRSPDRPFVIHLAESLQQNGHDVWLDQWRITGREPYWDEIQNAIESVSHFIFVISPDSVNKDPVNGARKELYHAANLAKGPIIVPVLARETPFTDLPIVITPGMYQIHDFVHLPYQKALLDVLSVLNNEATVVNRVLKPAQPVAPVPPARKRSGLPLALIGAAVGVLAIALIIAFVASRKPPITVAGAITATLGNASPVAVLNLTQTAIANGTQVALGAINATQTAQIGGTSTDVAGKTFVAVIGGTAGAGTLTAQSQQQGQTAAVLTTQTAVANQISTGIARQIQTSAALTNIAEADQTSAAMAQQAQTAVVLTKTSLAIPTATPTPTIKPPTLVVVPTTAIPHPDMTISRPIALTLVRINPNQSTLLAQIIPTATPSPFKIKITINPVVIGTLVASTDTPTAAASSSIPKLVFFHTGSNTFVTGYMQDNLFYQLPKTGDSSAADWTQLVGTTNGLVVLYNAANGAIEVGRVGEDGAYQVLETDTLSAGYTNLIGLANQSVLFYKRDDGSCAIGQIGTDNILKIGSNSPCADGATAVGSGESGHLAVFYNENTQNISTWAVGDGKTLTQKWLGKPDAADSWFSLTDIGNNRIYMYAKDGIGTVFQISATGSLTPIITKSTDTTIATHIVSSNGQILFYETTSGAVFYGAFGSDSQLSVGPQQTLNDGWTLIASTQ